MSNNKQSSIDFLDKEMTSLNFDYLTGQVTNKEFNERSKVIMAEAKAMHKEEIEDAYWEGGIDVPSNGQRCQDYYHETFGEK